MELISRNGYCKLSKDIEDINKKIIETKATMKESATSGHSKEERIEFLENEQNFLNELESKRASLEMRKRNCRMIEELYGEFDGSVRPGTNIVIQFGEEIPESYTILGEKEAKSSKGILSPNGPLVKELMGKKAGDTLEFGGETVKLLKVSSI